MKGRANKSIVALLILSLTVYGPIWGVAGTEAIDPADDSDAALAQGTFSEDELNELLAPIALYPDPLLAQILPASTFVDQLEEASRTLGGRVNESLIERQNWDVSVKSVAHYPEVVQMMAQDRDWTIALGQAVVNQQADVLRAIQRLREQARAAGNLQSNEKMTVAEQSQGGQEMITIEPAQPQMIYVPQYNPAVVYGGYDYDYDYPVAAGLISFGAGFAIGSWLNRRFDWWRWGFPYHGWIGGGWIARSRPFVNIHNNFYVNNRYRNFRPNRNILRRDISRYRGSLRREAVSHRQWYGRGRPGSRPSDLRRPARDLRPAGRPSDLRRPSTDRRDLKRTMGRPSGIRRPAMGTREFRRPTSRPSEIGRPMTVPRTMHRPAAGSRHLRQPSQMRRGSFGGARIQRGGAPRIQRGGMRGGFRGGRGRRH